MEENKSLFAKVCVNKLTQQFEELLSISNSSVNKPVNKLCKSESNLSTIYENINLHLEKNQSKDDLTSNISSYSTLRKPIPPPRPSLINNVTTTETENEPYYCNYNKSLDLAPKMQNIDLERNQIIGETPSKNSAPSNIVSSVESKKFSMPNALANNNKIKRSISSGKIHDSLDSTMDYKITSKASAVTSTILDYFKRQEYFYLEELKKVIPIFTYGLKNVSLLGELGQLEICELLNQLLQHQVKFQKLLSFSSNSIIEVLHIFVDSRELFKIYGKFLLCAGSDFALELSDANDTKKERTRRISLNSKLSTHLTRYGTFLGRIKKQLCSSQGNKSDFLTNLINYAIEIINHTLNLCNSNLILQKITHIKDAYKNSPEDFYEIYGKHHFTEKFKISRPYKEKNSILHLFDKAIIFTQFDIKSGLYYYDHEIMFKSIQPLDNNKEERTISIYYYNENNKEKELYKIEALSKEVKVKWDTKIRDILWTQYEGVRSQSNFFNIKE